MKYLLLSSLIIFISLGLVSTTPTPAKKVKYTSTEGKLKVVFPDAYTTTEMNDDGVRTLKTQAQLDEKLFFVAYTLHETELDDHYNLATISLESFAEALSSDIIEQSDWKIKKNIGKRAMLYSSEEKLKGEYRAVIVGQIQYQLIAISSVDSWDEKLAKKFIKSFKIKK
jgi:hypothetical protein